MDPGLSLMAMDASPLPNGAALVWRGPYGVIAVPMAAFSPPQLAALARTSAAMPVATRVAWLVTADDEPAAAAVVHEVPWPWPADVLAAMQVWSGRAAAALGVPAQVEGLRVVQGDLPAARPAWDAALAVLPGLAPRWLGPVVLVVGDAPLPGLPPGETHFARPVLPLMRCPQATMRASELARRMVALVLDVQPRPPGGVPPWLVRGLAGLAAAAADGRLPGPRALLDRRAAAGLAALQRTLTDDDPDPALAEAVAGSLLAPWRPGALPMVLDRLHDGASSEAALVSALRITLADLCVQR